MFKNRKVIILSFLLLFVAIAIVFIFIMFKENPVLPPVPAYQPEFLNASEKQNLGLPASSRIQALKRDAGGQVMIYKIIRNDSDIVTDPSQVGPVSPRLP